VGQKKYNGLELDERTGARFVGHGFSRDTRLPNDVPYRSAAVSPSVAVVFEFRLPPGLRVALSSRPQRRDPS
jgi:hypothetical protein